MRIFSFDPAEINMGFVCVEWEAPTIARLAALREAISAARIATDFIALRAALLDAVAYVQGCIVVRCLRNISVAQYDEQGAHCTAQRGESAVLRAMDLRRTLGALRQEFGDPDLTIVEFQMGLNGPTVALSHQLMYEFCSRPTLCMMPGLKNTIDLDQNEPYAVVQSRYTSNYLGNKAHSRVNLAHFLRNWAVAPAVVAQVPRGTRASDIADAFMQCVVCIRGIVGGQHVYA